jgi:hypothetical protein
MNNQPGGAATPADRANFPTGWHALYHKVIDAGLWVLFKSCVNIDSVGF